MIKKLGLATAMSALLLSGCGGGSDSKSITEQMKEREVIAIFYSVPADICESQELKDELANEGATNILTSVESNTINCGSYDRNNDFISCGEENLFLGADTSCVIGADEVTGATFNSTSMIATVPDMIMKTL